MSTVRFLAPPPGLEADEFTLEPVAGAEGLSALRSTGSDATRLFVLDTAAQLRGYAPGIDAETLERLGAHSPDELRVLVVISPRRPEPTLNLLAPVLVHRETGAAVQLILDDEDWPLRAPLSVLTS